MKDYGLSRAQVKKGSKARVEVARGMKAARAHWKQSVRISSSQDALRKDLMRNVSHAKRMAEGVVPPFYAGYAKVLRGKGR